VADMKLEGTGKTTKNPITKANFQPFMRLEHMQYTKYLGFKLSKKTGE
jgi:hypothetical protein